MPKHSKKKERDWATTSEISQLEEKIEYLMQMMRAQTDVIHAIFAYLKEKESDAFEILDPFGSFEEETENE